MSGIDDSTAKPLAGMPPSTYRRDHEEGPVEIGRDFFINRGFFRDVETASSLSSLSEVIASTSNLHIGGQSTGDTGRATLSALRKKGRRSVQVHLDTVEASPPRRETDTPTPKAGSPWYIVNSPRGVDSKVIETALCVPGEDGSKRPSPPSSDGFMMDVPKTRLSTSRGHLDELLSFQPPLCLPPPPPHHAALDHCTSDDVEVSGLSHVYASDISSVNRDEGFLAYVGEKYSNTSRKMKLLFVSVAILFLVCIIAITAASLNIKLGNGNNNGDGNPYQVDQSDEDDGYFPLGLESNSSSTTNEVVFDFEEDHDDTDSFTPSSSPSDTTTRVPTTESPSVLLALPTSESPVFLTALTSEPTIGLISQTLVLTPVSDTKILEESSSNNYGTDSYLTVKGLRGASSFLRFDISAVAGNAVSIATLRVRSILRENNEIIGQDIDGLATVNVDFLPFAGIWDENMVTYDNNPIIPINAVSVGSFSVEGYPYDLSSYSLQRAHEVDVTKIFRSSTSSEGFTTITFMLYSDDDSPQGIVDFASTDWSKNFGGPVLVIELSETQYPTTSPAKSASPTSAPVSSPTPRPSTSPTPSPTPEPSTSPTPSPTPEPSTSPTPKPSIPPTPEPSSPLDETSPPTPSPLDVCTAECENESDAAANIYRENCINNCVRTTEDGVRQCKNNCKSEAEKAKEEALKLCKKQC